MTFHKITLFFEYSFKSTSSSVSFVSHFGFYCVFSYLFWSSNVFFDSQFNP